MMSICVHNIIYININVMVLRQGNIISKHTCADTHTYTQTHTYTHTQRILNHLLVPFCNIYTQDSASHSHQPMVSLQKIQQSLILWS